VRTLRGLSSHGSDRCLTRQVASDDAGERNYANLTAYSDLGELPGVWRVPGLDGLERRPAVADRVDEQKTVGVVPCGRHPNADAVEPLSALRASRGRPRR
jgi:hypothetical protein